MGKVSPNFDEEFTPNKPGTYLCKIISGELKVGTQKGTQYINWKLETTDGRTVYHSTPIEGRGAGIFKHFVHSAGDKAYEKGEYDTDELIGQMVSMKLDIEQKLTRDGRTVNVFKVANVDPPSLAQLEQLRITEDDLAF